MRVLHINNADVGHGGAALAAVRLNQALNAAGAQSTMRVAARASNDPTIKQLPQWRRSQRVLGYGLRRIGLNDLNGLVAFTLDRLPDHRAADVVHFHLLEGNYLSYPAMVRLTRSKPTVLTLHDMWAATGHCSYSYECERWRTGCGHCPHLDVYPHIHRDGTALEWRIKKEVWRRSRLTVLTPSRWLASVAEDSILGHFPIKVVPIALDTGAYVPRDRDACRAALGIAGVDVVLALTAADFNDPRKGTDLLEKALFSLDLELRHRTTLLMMGWRGDAFADRLRVGGFRVEYLGYIWADSLKATVYSASDLFVLPTRADNSPLALLESLACGTPAVSFAVGGVPEIVRHGETGLLAAPDDPASLAAELARVLGDRDLARRLGDNGRKLVEATNAAPRVAALHMDVYEEMLG